MSDVTVTFTIPQSYADGMHQKSSAFYLDVFGCVRDSETTDAIGRWRQDDPR